jgi:hypothetical protein
VGSTVARRGEEEEVSATLSVGPTANPVSFLRKAILHGWNWKAAVQMNGLFFNIKIYNS